MSDIPNPAIVRPAITELYRELEEAYASPGKGFYLQVVKIGPATAEINIFSATVSGVPDMDRPLSVPVTCPLRLVPALLEGAFCHCPNARCANLELPPDTDPVSWETATPEDLETLKETLFELVNAGK
jgi:hypothetical protein